jgi:Flp pilus assembly protein TadD
MAAHPGLTAIGIALSRLQATTGAHAQAVATAEAATLIEPLDPAALEQLASLHADAGDAAKLQPVAAALRERFGNRPGARYYSAVSSFLRQDFNSALGLARETIAVDPKHAAAHNLLGAIYASMNQPQAARESFETVLRLNPSDASAYTNLGLLALESGDRKSAANLFVEALSLDPQSLAARDGLAQAHAHP